MLAAGIPLVQAFEIVGVGHEKPSMQKLILDIKPNVEGGSTLHESLAKHPLYFDDLFVNLVEAGEQAGALEIAARQGRDLQGKDRGPQEEDQEGAVLPGRRARGRGHRDADPADLRDPAVRGAVQGLRRGPAGVHARGHRPLQVRADPGLVDGRSVRRRRHVLPAHEEALARRCASSSTALSLKIPIIGPILVKAAIARYARTLSTMFTAGVPLVEAMESVAGATGNIVYERRSCACATRSRPASACSARWRTRACSRTWSSR